MSAASDSSDTGNLPYHVAGLFVGAQPAPGRLAQTAIRGPFTETHLPHQHRLNERQTIYGVWKLCVERGFVGV